MNPNSSLASLFSRKMLSIGVEVIVLNDSDVGLRASILGESDCAIVISYSGSIPGRAPLEVLPILIANNVPIIAITSCGENELRKVARYSFAVSSHERLYSKISTFASEISILYILNVLFAVYFSLDYDENLNYKLSKSLALEEVNRFSAYDDIKEKNNKN